MSDAGRVSCGLIRTLLRLVNWLPILYFITMLATGVRRQRVGDLAAGTSVVRTPVHHRGLAVVWLAAVGLAVYRVNSPAPLTYRAHGVSFDYPARWHVESYEPTVTAGGAQDLWTTAVGPGREWDLISVDASAANQPVRAPDIDAVIPDVESLTRQLFDQAGGAPVAGPEKITMTGQPAAHWEYGQSR